MENLSKRLLVMLTLLLLLSAAVPTYATAEDASTPDTLPSEEEISAGANGELVPAGDSDFPDGSLAYGIDSAANATSGGGGNCSIYARDPYRSNGHIKGYGWQICSGPYHLQRLTVTLQQYRGAGLWANKDQNPSAWTSDDFRRQSVSWDCAPGTGLQTYRIITNGEFIDGDGRTYRAAVESFNYLRIRCGG